jgi:hypothetical protein
MARIGSGGGGSGGSGGTQNAFTIVQPKTGTSPTADTSTSTLTLTNADGSLIVVGDSSTKKVTINGVAFTGDAGAGGSLGMVPGPAAGDGSTKFLRADGTWQVPTGVSQAVVSGWGFSGNAGTNSIIHFVGTADNTSFNIGVSSIFRMTFGLSGPISTFQPIQFRSANGAAFFATDNTNAISIVGHSVVAGYTLKLPNAIGTTNQVLTLSDPTTGQLTFASTANGFSFIPLGVTYGGIGTTQLTNLGVLYGASNQPILATAAGSTNQVLVGGISAPGFTNTPTVNNINVGFPNSITGVLRFGHAGSGNFIQMQGISGQASTTYTLPSADGTASQILSTNGSGVMSWVTQTLGFSYIPLGVTFGGIGTTQLSLNQLVIGQSNGPLTTIPTGSTNTLLSGAVTSPGFTNAPTVNTMNLGIASNVTGSLKLSHASSAFVTSIQSGNATSAATYSLPTADGTTKQVLNTDGSGNLSWSSVSTLGGGQSFQIPHGISIGGTGSTVIVNNAVAIGTSTGFVYTSQGSTNQVLVGGGTVPGWTQSPQINSLIVGITGVATGSLRFAHINSGNLVTFAAGTSTLAQSYTWPTGDGTNGQVFTTNGSGGLSWTTVSGGGGGGFSGILGITMGGTGNTTVIQYGLAYGSSPGIRYTAQGVTWSIPISDGAQPGWTTSPTTLGLRLGVANQQTGSFRFAHANSANEITFRGASGMAATTYIFPGSDGATFAPLVTNSAGQMSWLALKSNCSFTIDGGGSAITTGVKGYVRVPFNCVITSWDIVADQSGSVVVDVWLDTYANFPPTVADTIAASAKPTLSSAQKNQDSTLTGWTKNLTEGSYLGFNVDSASTVTRVTVTLSCTRMG